MKLAASKEAKKVKLSTNNTFPNILISLFKRPFGNFNRKPTVEVQNSESVAESDNTFSTNNNFDGTDFITTEYRNLEYSDDFLGAITSRRNTIRKENGVKCNIQSYNTSQIIKTPFLKLKPMKNHLINKITDDASTVESILLQLAEDYINNTCKKLLREKMRDVSRKLRNYSQIQRFSLKLHRTRPGFQYNTGNITKQETHFDQNTKSTLKRPVLQNNKSVVKNNDLKMNVPDNIPALVTDRSRTVSEKTERSQPLSSNQNKKVQLNNIKEPSTRLQLKKNFNKFDVKYKVIPKKKNTPIDVQLSSRMSNTSKHSALLHRLSIQRAVNMDIEPQVNKALNFVDINTSNSSNVEQPKFSHYFNTSPQAKLRRSVTFLNPCDVNVTSPLRRNACFLSNIDISSIPTNFNCKGFKVDEVSVKAESLTHHKSEIHDNLNISNGNCTDVSNEDSLDGQTTESNFIYSNLKNNDSKHLSTAIISLQSTSTMNDDNLDNLSLPKSKSNQLSSNLNEISKVLMDSKKSSDLNLPSSSKVVDWERFNPLNDKYVNYSIIEIVNKSSPLTFKEENGSNISTEKEVSSTSSNPKDPPNRFYCNENNRIIVSGLQSKETDSSDAKQYQEIIISDSDDCYQSPKFFSRQRSKTINQLKTANFSSMETTQPMYSCDWMQSKVDSTDSLDDSVKNVGKNLLVLNYPEQDFKYSHCALTSNESQLSKKSMSSSLFKHTLSSKLKIRDKVKRNGKKP